MRAIQSLRPCQSKEPLRACRRPKRQPLRARVDARQSLRSRRGEIQSLRACRQKRQSLRALAREESLRPVEVSSRSALEARYDAAASAVAALENLAGRGLNPVTAALGGVRAVEEWAHYPDGDARDARARTRYYYHVHSADEVGENEHGHFHVFLEPPGEARDSAPTHIVGLAMDASGALLRLFTTNRWVTGETWRDASSIAASLADFEIGSSSDRADLDTWVSSIVRLYQPRIEHLLHLRDAALQAMRARDPNGDALEDRSARLLSETRVDFLQELEAIEEALDRAAHA